MQLNCHSVAVALTLVQIKQIRINIHKRNNTKKHYKQYKNAVNTSTLIIKTPTNYKTQTYTHPHITKSTHNHTLQNPHIHTPTHYKTHTYTNPHITKPTYTHTHTLQNPHIHKPTHYKTHTYTHPHITKQVKTTIVQDTPKWNSHNTIKYPQLRSP